MGHQNRMAQSRCTWGHLGGSKQILLRRVAKPLNTRNQRRTVSNDPNQITLLKQQVNQLREALVDKHKYLGHLIEGNCEGCEEAMKTFDENQACDQYRDQQKKFLAAIRIPVYQIGDEQ